MGVPVLERKPAQRKVSGKVFCGEGISQVPANHASVELVGGAKTVASVSTGNDGAYEISASLDPDSSYSLSAKGSCGKSSRGLPKDLSTLSGADLFLRK
ncbi:MAG: hypothetical protein AAB250_06360 [Bdellovibrionota bacterium]